MKVINPTSKRVAVTINGTEYSVEAEDFTSNIPAKVAEDWKTKTHNFLSIEEDDVVAPVVEEKKEEVKKETPEVKKETTEPKEGDEDYVSKEDMKAIDEAIEKSKTSKKEVKKTTNKK